jgi:putative ABC transport system permease protein
VRRLALAVAEVGFAVVLMFMQLGFRNALFDSTVKVVTDLDADLLLRNKAQYALPSRQSFDYRRLCQARGCPGVAGVYPFYIESAAAVWEPAVRGKPYPIRTLAFNLNDPVFLTPEIRAQLETLRPPGTALIDSRSKEEYKVPDSLEIRRKQQGAELANREIRLVGVFSMGTDFANDGNLVMSDANFAKYFPYRAGGEDPLSAVDLAVVRVKPEAGIRTVKRELEKRFEGTEVGVYLKQDFITNEIRFWDRSTPIGYIFLTGTIMGFIVVVIVCFQIIYAEIADHMAEYATLKALGYKNGYFIGLVFQMAFYLSIIGYFPGLLISLAMYAWLAYDTGLLLEMTLSQAALVLVLTLGMCTASGCLAMWKLLAADPAELFA